MKRKIKRVSASVALFMIGLMFSLPFFALSANAETNPWEWRTERSGTIHQVVVPEGEHTGSHFNLSYEVKGGRDFRLHFDDDWDKWQGAGKVLEMIGDAADVDGFIKYERRFYFSTTITLGSKKFKIMLDILKMLETFGTIACPLGTYLIKLIFGTLPAAPAPINVPKDPPLPEEV